MSDKEWGDEPTGFGMEHKIKEDTGMLRNTGCAVTEMSNVVSSASGRDITPKDINDDKSNFIKDTDLLNMKKVAEDNKLNFDYWTKDKQGDLSKKIKENIDSDKKYYISGQVKYDEEGHLHWVGIEDIKIGKDGKFYVKIAPTSVNDTNKKSQLILCEKPEKGYQIIGFKYDKDSKQFVFSLGYDADVLEYLYFDPYEMKW